MMKRRHAASSVQQDVGKCATSTTCHRYALGMLYSTTRESMTPPRKWHVMCTAFVCTPGNQQHTLDNKHSSKGTERDGLPVARRCRRP